MEFFLIFDLKKLGVTSVNHVSKNSEGDLKVVQT